MTAAKTADAAIRTEPDFAKLLRKQKQMFWFQAASFIYFTLYAGWLLTTSGSTAMLLLTAVLLVSLTVLLYYFFIAQHTALLASGDDEKLTIHFTPFHTAEIRYHEISSYEWKANQLQIQGAGAEYKLYIGWMSYKDNRAYRTWIEERLPS
ncbi:MAG: hypothetical protein JJU35_05335 [Balneolales bacterium]|nr:hypothetical protein [Balneolales bacterium]